MSRAAAETGKKNGKAVKAKRSVVRRRIAGKRASIKRRLSEITPLVVRPNVAMVMLDCGREKLYELISAGKVDSYKEGSARKITTASIHAYINDNLADKIYDQMISRAKTIRDGDTPDLRNVYAIKLLEHAATKIPAMSMDDVLQLTYWPRNRSGVLLMEDGACCDMNECVQLFAQIDPAIISISTHSGKDRDTVYRLENGKWAAFAPS